MPEALWAALVREYEQLARVLGLPDDTCFVCMEQGCHHGSKDHTCTCLLCVRSGRAFDEEN
jgi:hypothetical protein